ncbi:beta-1,4-N-acetylgalactosaminyltransferase bre-4-like [Centruroides vittatus]|uniref:beta-1,4-N-acetylgalactosaminyltransferase bre-4-like n=1 Tax=Centruroides vittatus TaxID=120091 RepID=UPI0035100141
MRLSVIHVVCVRSMMKLLRQTPFVLLMLTVSSLIFVTLLELAVSHIKKKSGFKKVNEEIDSSGESKDKSQKLESLRLEAVYDQTALTVDANIHFFRNYINVARIRQLLRIMSDSRQWSNGTEEENGDGRVVNSLKPCPEIPPGLVGRMKIDLKNGTSKDLETIRINNPEVKLGGAYSPKDCKSRYRVAVIIPYRDRIEHLSSLLYYLHPILQRQQLEYKIYVVEQNGNQTFNKGVLMNAGVKEALREFDYHCFVFHDVDMLPEDDRNMYSCPQTPRHMSVAVDKFNYTLPYSLLVGGVLAINTDHLLLVNGYSNLYWGWGGEDDDMAYRLTHNKLNLIRPADFIGRYTMIKHSHRTESPSNIRYALLKMAKKRSKKEGLNSVKYSLNAVTPLPLYTHLLIDIGSYHEWKYSGNKKLIVNF